MTTDSPFVPKQDPVRYKTIRVNELDIFYREAAPNRPDYPAAARISDFVQHVPESDLATSFRVLAPDYPGFGQSNMPSHKDLDYSFENLTNVVEELVEKLGLTKYSLYVMDYGRRWVIDWRCGIPIAYRR